MNQSLLELFLYMACLCVVATTLCLAWPLDEKVVQPSQCIKIWIAYSVFVVLHVVDAGKKQFKAVQLVISLSVPAVVGVCAQALQSLDGTPSPNFNSPSTYLGVFCILTSVPWMIYTIYLFYSKGDGTLSPAPNMKTEHLVTSGPYQYTRNPMITGVLGMLMGRTLLSGSQRLAVFTACFSVVKTLWFKYCEEPDMRNQFGATYQDYCQHVPRWVPRMAPYKKKAE